MTHRRPSIFSRFALSLLLLLPCGTVASGDRLPELCKLLLHEESNDREDFALELDIARTESQAARDVFALVDRLWQEDAYELLLYLEYKRNQEFTRVDEKRAELVLARQDALLEGAALLCEAAVSGDAAENRTAAIARARDLYLELDCSRLAQGIEMARVELEYAEQVRDAYVDLRQYAASSAIDVMAWNYSVEIASKKLAHATRRAKACRASLDPSGETAE